MNAGQDHPEQEVRQRLAEWSKLLDVEVPPVVLQRLKSAVRAELGDMLPAGFPDPLPSQAVLAGVRRAVRAELAGTGGGRAQAFGALAAAAVLGVCVGLIHLAGTQGNGGGGGSSAVMAEAQASVELFVLAAERALTAGGLSGGLDERLEMIEEDLDDWRLRPDDHPIVPDAEPDASGTGEPLSGPVQPGQGAVG